MTTTIAESALDLDNPRPGIYPGISFSDYSKIRAMNCSTLKWAEASMLHLKAAIDGKLESKDTPAKLFGRCLHTRLLEPEVYAHRVILKGTCTMILKAGDRKGEPCGHSGVGLVGEDWRCKQHGGDDKNLNPDFEYLPAADGPRIEAAVESLKKRKSDNLRRAPGMFEVVMIAELCGVICKARLDKWIPNPATIVDVKKVDAPVSPDRVSVNSENFEPRIANMGYGMQAAMYCDIAAELTGKMPRWFWLPIEDDEPYASGCIQASDLCLGAGRNEYRGWLHQYKRSLETNEWPGPSDEPALLDGPKWWRDKHGV